jgi:hypothetical protein
MLKNRLCQREFSDLAEKNFRPPTRARHASPGRTGDRVGRTRARNRLHHIRRATRRMTPMQSHKGRTVARDNGKVIHPAGGGQHGPEEHSPLATPCRRGSNNKARGDVATGPCSHATAEPCYFRSLSGRPDTTGPGVIQGWSPAPGEPPGALLGRQTLLSPSAFGSVATGSLSVSEKPAPSVAGNQRSSKRKL